MVSESKIEVLAKETGLQYLAIGFLSFLLIPSTPQKPSGGDLHIYDIFGTIQGVFNIRGMGLQLILLNFLNFEAQKIEGYVTQNDVPGPLVNLSLLAMGPSLNKNETN